MRSAVLTTALLASFATNVWATSGTSGVSAAFEEQMDELMEMMDADNDGGLSQSEMDNMMDRLGMSTADLTRLCSCTTASFFSNTTYDLDDNGVLDTSELMNLAINNAELGPDIAAALQNMPSPSQDSSTLLADVTNPAPAILTAVAKAICSVAVAGPLFPGDRINMKEAFATFWGIDAKAVTMQFKKRTVASSGDRRLTASAETVDVSATGYFASEDAAQAATAKVGTSMGDASMASSVLGVTVTETPTAEVTPVVGNSPMPTGSFAILVILIIGPLVLCCVASWNSGRKIKNKNIPSQGCFKTGCCSYHALSSWATGTVAGAALLLLGMLLLYTTVDAFVSAVTGIINELIDAKTMTGSQVQEITSQIPDDILKQVKEFLPLFRIAVVLPGVLAALLLTVVSLCGLYGGKSFCCTKLIIFPLCYVALVVCIVFYFIFFTLALLMFVPQAQEQLRKGLAICDTGLPILQQTVDDAEKLVTQINALPAGSVPAADIATVQDAYDQGVQAAGLFTRLCGHAGTLISSIEGLLFPSLLSIIAAFYSFYAVNGVWCAAGCCTYPKDGAQKIHPEKK